MKKKIENDNWNKLFNDQKSVTNEKKDINQPHLIDSYFFIYDCLINEILFINNAFKTVTGYDDKTFTVDQLIKMIHPSDLEYFFQCEEKDLNFTNSLLFNQHYQYILSYTYKIITSTNEIITIQQQCQTIEFTDQGHLSKTLVIHKRVPNYIKRPINDHKIFDKSKNVFIDSENCYNLTKREFEILNLVKEGYNTNQIADKLSISKYTIDTHRKNILYKSNSKNFIELIKKMSFNNYI